MYLCNKKEKHNHPVSVFRCINIFDIYTVWMNSDTASRVSCGSLDSWGHTYVLDEKESANRGMCGTKPNDLVTSCHWGWLTDGPFLLTAACKGRQQRQKSGSPGLKQDTSAHISSARRRFFRGCEASPQDVNAWTGHSPPSQGNAKRLSCDKPEINWRYYMSEGSAVCYIRG